ncbi:MAG: HlyC/CorC family transporter [Euryarchaeota archaeon]|nr:HlyC/CorC family transporter [Euryarchaeota archaeon]
MPDTSLIFQIAALVVLLFLSGFFSGSETALVSVNKLRIRKLAEEGDQGAEMANRLLQRPNRMLATILLGNNLINILAAAIATNLAINLFGSKGIGIATGVMTFFILIFGEITPKGFATKNAEYLTLKVAKPILFLSKLFSPVIWGITLLTRRIIKAIGGDPDIVAPFVTEEEIKFLVEIGEEEGVIEKGEKEMIKGVFEFGDMTAKEVMVPRIDISRLSADEPLSAALEHILSTGHSRTPVFEGNVDNIIGLLYTKDLLAYLKEGKKDMPIKEILREAYFVPESKPLDELLREMQDKKIQMAIVVDEYGGTAGLVTLEDILEEIVGEIIDEYDVEEAGIKDLGDGSYLVDAKMDIDEINEVLGLDLPSEEFDSIGGLLFNRLGQVPVKGDKVEVDGVELIVERMRVRRITKIRLVIKERPPRSRR